MLLRLAFAHGDRVKEMGEIVDRLLGESPNVAHLEELQRSIHAVQSARCAPHCVTGTSILS